ncbi:hypothetical protein HPB50_004849 [Hyalomma asiaticum]|uniref:Uncharacterized protein n=1 Tax=Hyalomma asiaticum TaxID=266040 RepID=A0ACB7SBI5_HYAAI|nr:hypothetical protein HPB50_004849 [Hyalomma asiaticum]
MVKLLCKTECVDEDEAACTQDKPEPPLCHCRRADKYRPPCEHELMKQRTLNRYHPMLISLYRADKYLMTPCMIVFVAVSMVLAAYLTARSEWATLRKADSAFASIEQMVLTMMFMLMGLLLFIAYLFFWSVTAKFFARRFRALLCPIVTGVCGGLHPRSPL